MRKSCQRSILIFAVTIQLFCVGSAVLGKNAVVFKPDPQLQILFDRIARTPRTTPESCELIAELNGRIQAMKGNEGVAVMDILHQAAHYSAHGKREVNQFGAGFEPSIALHLVARGLDISRGREISALIPLLDSEDEQLRSFVLAYISDAARQPDRPEPNEATSVLIRYVEARQNNPPSSVVELLYQNAPTAALHYFAGTSFHERKGGAETRRAVYWADHVIHDVIWKQTYEFLKPGEIELAVAELDKLSQFQEWWAKRYVITMLWRHKEFRDAKILERLRKDSNPLISKAANEPFPPEREEEGIFRFRR